MADRITAQLAFLTEADRLKSVDRANVLMDCSRPENSAEHSWHLALWVLIFAEDEVSADDLGDALRMALLHDLVEIDAGDHPIHLAHDMAAVLKAETAAADRIFTLLPDDQAVQARRHWDLFEDGQTPASQVTKIMDMAQPLFQELGKTILTQTDRDIMRSLLDTGRPAALADTWPEVYHLGDGMLEGHHVSPAPELAARLRFLAEADQLKSTLRATTLCDASRRENSAEHSWHIALYAMILAEHAINPVDATRVICMLLIHDLVEIDAGDTPIHAAAARDTAAQDAAEQSAATRIFGMLPTAQGQRLRALWDEFEAAQTDDAIFAKSIDRVQPVIANLETGGGTWPEYNVTLAQLQTRVGDKVARGAPTVWDALNQRITTWFAEHAV